MTETIEILKTHLIRYPLMQPRDCIKLLYQNEFGCGHIIEPVSTDENELASMERVLIRLKEEAENTPKDPSHILYEPIGGGYVRVHLEALEGSAMNAQTLAAAFIRSANEPTGCRSGFEEKLTILKNLCKEVQTAFDFEELNSFLKEYRRHWTEQIPSVHHSEVFRREYHPAYRVVKEEYIEF